MPEAPNPNQPQPVDSTSFVVPAFSFGLSQDFPIEFEPSGKFKHIAFDFSPDRSIDLSPGQEVTLTNVDDPSHSVTLNITGSFHHTTLENGFVLTEYDGRNLLGDDRIDNGQPGLVLAIGHFSTIQDSTTGQIVQFLEGQGRVVDVIDLLI
jgi:hypothetical protein